MRSEFKGTESSVDFQQAWDDCDHEYVCYECSIIDHDRLVGDAIHESVWLASPIDALRHLQQHATAGGIVPNRLVHGLQDRIRRLSHFHQSPMSPGRRCDGSHAGKREKAFHDQWNKEQSPRYRTDPLGEALLRGFGINDGTPRELAIMAGMVQWLGTSVGFCFMEQALGRCGYEIVPKDVRSDA
ncbi:MAG: hypothetical protein AAGJ40_09245 [Planctomycetota bacterium]